MSVENFAQELVSDLWSFDFTSQPVSEIPAAALSQSNSVEPAQEIITPTTFQEFILAHPIRKTTKRDTRTDLVRGKCQMKDDSGCLGQSKYECHHEACLKKVTPSGNRFADTTGVFVCCNPACQLKH